eukprot:2112812-Lingulodinium_polyedra.AAC.1
MSRATLPASRRPAPAPRSTQAAPPQVRRGKAQRPPLMAAFLGRALREAPRPSRRPGWRARHRPRVGPVAPLQHCGGGRCHVVEELVGRLRDGRQRLEE